MKLFTIFVGKVLPLSGRRIHTFAAKTPRTQRSLEHRLTQISWIQQKKTNPCLSVKIGVPFLSLPCEILALLNSEGLFNRGRKHYFTGVGLWQENGVCGLCGERFQSEKYRAARTNSVRLSVAPGFTVLPPASDHDWQVSSMK